MRSLKARTSLAVLSVASLTLLFTFQNCAQKFGFDAVAPSVSAFSATTFVTINSGALYTRDAGVKVQVKAPLADEMYLTNDATCESGGTWESIKAERPWVLAQLNSQATVYAKFKAASGASLACVNASIIHDDVAPKVSFVTKPSNIMGAGDAVHSFGADDLSGSGLDHYECRANTATDFAACASTLSLRDLLEGQQRLLVRAVDRAGNVSQPIENDWLVDMTGPQIAFTERPVSPNNKTSAIFRFDVTDALSGVGAISCRLDLNGVKGQVNTNCTPPASYSALGSDTTSIRYTFNVWAADKVGNASSVSSYDFIVDRAPSGAFDVIGLSGGTDVTPDKWLGTVPNPTVTWTQSAGASQYYVAILNQSGSQVVCPEVMVASAATSYGFPLNTCSLVDGTNYVAHVRALTALGNERVAPPFPFTVDLSPPVINITGPVLTNDDKDAVFNFTMADAASGIAAATCTRSLVGGAVGTDVTMNCKDLTTTSYLGLTPGSAYTFKISASDVAGNKVTSAPVQWRVNQVVCNPFDQIDSSCVKGLKANLYYLPAALQGKLAKVDEYFAQGTQANVLIYMSQLFVPSGAWTKGFGTTDQGVIMVNGQVLQEYFAIDLETFVKLDPAMNPAGKYQFAILSDDGSVVQTRPSATAAWTTLIDADGNHATTMGCDLKGVDFTASTRLNMRVKYFQGPRTHIALTLMWRPMPAAVADQKDVDCGLGGNDTYFGDVVNNPADYKNYEYGKLIGRGWKPLSTANFISGTDVTTVAPTPTPTATPAR